MIEVMITHRAPFPKQLGVATSLERNPQTMERITEEQIKAHLMETNEEFRRLAAEHSDYARRLDDLEARLHLSEQEQVEEVRLKKLKLRLKDQMEAIVRGSRSQQVA